MAAAKVVVPLLLTSRSPSAWTAPTTPVSVTAPVPDESVRLRGVVSLLSVSENTMLPAPVSVLMLTSPVSVTGVAKLMLVLVVLMLPAN